MIKNIIKNKSGKTEKGFAISGVFLMVMSLVSFSFVLGEVGVVRGGPCPQGQTLSVVGEGCVLISSTAPATSGATVVPAAGVNTLVSVGRSTTSSGSTIIFNNEKYLVTSGTVESGKDIGVVNILTGQEATLKNIGADVVESSEVATAVESKFGQVIVDNPLLELSKGQTTLANLLGKSPQTLIENPSILEKAGYTLEKSGENLVLTSTKDGSIYTLNSAGTEILSTQQQQTYSLFGTTLTGTWAHLAQGVTWALGIVAGIQVLFPMFGASPETTSAATKAAVIGVVAWKGLDIAAPYIADSLEFLPSACLKNPLQGLGWCSAGAGLAVGALVFLFLYKSEEEKVITFTCSPWQAPTGGDFCEQCNQQGDLPCSEYQCRSLGQACQIVNPGTNEEKCVWVNRQDVNPPTIEPLESALLNDYRYAPDNAISPPDRGVKVNYLKSQDNCIPAFTPLQFGVELNEPASCKIDVLRKGSFEEMSSFIGGGLLSYNHTFALSLPGGSNLEEENITIQNNGNYALYVRCQDANGNSNTATFLFKYCVDPGPDTTPPLIVTTSIVNGGAIAYNQSSTDIEVYTNEPSTCRWSHHDQDYENMEEQMQCSSSVFESNAQMLYKCSTTLTGLKDRVDNKFYFRCKDQPLAADNKRNTNSESYVFTLKGTQPLVIDKVIPENGTIKDSTDSVKVEINVTTSAGYDEGKAICYYSSTGNEGSYIKFLKTDSYKHAQDLFLTEGEYDYFIKCTDLGGNSDYKKINFDVKTDTESPIVVRAYKEDNYLKLTTDEAAECVYSTFDCNYAFDEGTKMTTLEKKNHFTDWVRQQNTYVKCRDNFGNEPLPNSCSILVRGR